MGSCYLYVLRYNYSGNYYVGSTTKNLTKRMYKHFVENCNKGTPCWSCKNKTSKGYNYYWYKVDEKGDFDRNADYSEAKLQSIGDCCENIFTVEIMEEIKKLTANEIGKKIYIYGGCLVKPPYPKVKSIGKNALEEDEIQLKIHNYLNMIKEHKLETRKGVYYITKFNHETWDIEKQKTAKTASKQKL